MDQNTPSPEYMNEPSEQLNTPPSDAATVEEAAHQPAAKLPSLAYVMAHPAAPADSAPKMVSDLLTKVKPDAEPDYDAGNEPVPSIDVNRLTMNYTAIALVFLAVGLLIGWVVWGRNSSNSSVDLVKIQQMIDSAVAQAGGGSGGSDAVAMIDDDPTRGDSAAVVTIVEFSDFNCGYCGRFATTTLPQLVETYGDKIRFVYRDMPIIGGDVSVQSAIAAECANDQGKFWDYHNLLFSNTQARGRDAYVNFATELELNTTDFTACLDSKDTYDEIILDYLDGQSLDITGTPAFFVNNKKVSGAQPYETFALLIDKELETAANAAVDTAS